MSEGISYFTDRDIRDKRFLKFLQEHDVLKRKMIRYLEFSGKYPVAFKTVSLVDHYKGVRVRVNGICFEEGETMIIPQGGIVSRSTKIEEGITVVLDKGYFEIETEIPRIEDKFTDLVIYSGVQLIYPTLMLIMSFQTVRSSNFLFARTTDVNFFHVLIMSPDRNVRRSLIRAYDLEPGGYLFGFKH
ncbi:hypothetical protein HS7_14960 [Sulfolobales archaeon HS-7]|nr:hypothetical protein HS7_14960 [Sulfolobales archaeon HS-7]